MQFYFQKFIPAVVILSLDFFLWVSCLIEKALLECAVTCHLPSSSTSQLFVNSVLTSRGQFLDIRKALEMCCLQAWTGTAVHGDRCCSQATAGLPGSCWEMSPLLSKLLS